jgi:hypothetical protein
MCVTGTWVPTAIAISGRLSLEDSPGKINTTGIRFKVVIIFVDISVQTVRKNDLTFLSLDKGLAVSKCHRDV